MSNLIDTANGINGASVPMSVSEFIEGLYQKNHDPIYCVGEQGLQVAIYTVGGGGQSFTGNLLGGSTSDMFIALGTSQGVKLFNINNIERIDIVSNCVRNCAKVNAAAFH